MLGFIIPPFLIGFGICLLMVYPTIRLAKALKLVDDPKLHKHPAMIHKISIPRAGGFPIIIAIVAGFIIFLPLNSIYTPIIFSSIIVVAVGLLDDKYDMSPYVRFIINILCA